MLKPLSQLLNFATQIKSVEATNNIKIYVNGINCELNLSCRGEFCFFSVVKIGLTIIKMMTPLRAHSCLLQVYEFVTECVQYGIRRGVEVKGGELKQRKKSLSSRREKDRKDIRKMPKTFVKF